MVVGWFGMPGALMPVAPYRGSLSERASREVSELVPFSGRRVVQVGPRGQRSWSMSVEGEPHNLAPLRFAATRPESWVWVSPAAQASNLLSPDQVMFEGSSASVLRGSLQVGDAWVSRWASGSTVSVTGAQELPVRAGVPVTVSAWTQRADPAVPVQLVFQMLDATGAVLQSISRNGPAGTGLQRVSWQLIPPTGAASVTVVIRFAVIVAAPQVTWTALPVPWADGRGVYRVLVSDWSEDQETVLPDGRLWVRASLTLMEVG